MYLCRYGCKGFTSVIFVYFEVAIFRLGEEASLSPSVFCALFIYGITVYRWIPWFPSFWGISLSPAAFLFSICISTGSSSFINRPSLISNCLQRILVIGSCVTFVWCPSKFTKCCFHSCIRSFSLVSFSLAFSVLFLLLTSFIVYHAILGCLSSTKSLILFIWFCMYSVCTFRYMLANPFCAF